MFLLSPSVQSSINSQSRLSEGDYEDILTERSRGPSGPYLEGNIKLIETIECPGDVMCCQFSPNGSIVAVGLTNGSIKLYSTSSGEILHSLSDDDTVRENLPVTQLKFRHFHSGESDDHAKIIIAAYASGLLKYWHFTSASCLHTLHEDRQILTMNQNPDGTRVITGGADGQIYVYDDATRQPLMICGQSDNRDVMDGHVFRVFAALYHPNIPNVFISGGWDNTVQYWDDRCRHSVRKIHGPHICGDALDIDSTHNHILTGSWRKHSVLQIWDFVSGKLIKDVPQDPMNESQLYCAKWVGKDGIACGGCDHNMARLVDRGTLNTVGQLVDLPQGVYCMDIDHSCATPRIVIGSNRFIFIVKGDKKATSYN